MQKYFSIILLMLITSFYGHSQALTINWYSWNEGYKKAKQTNKILLVDIYTDWCGWCKKMDKDTYTNIDVINLINKYFIAVKFNPEKTNVSYDVDGSFYDGRQLHAMLVNNQSTGYPTTVFLYTKERKLYLQPGYQGPEQFVQMLNKYIELQKNGE